MKKVFTIVVLLTAMVLSSATMCGKGQRPGGRIPVPSKSAKAPTCTHWCDK